MSVRKARLKRTCFLRSLQICCSTMVISRSTRSMFWISSSLEKRVGTRSRSGSMGAGLTGEMGSIFPIELLLLCSCTNTQKAIWSHWCTEYNVSFQKNMAHYCNIVFLLFPLSMQINGMLSLTLLSGRQKSVQVWLSCHRQCRTSYMPRFNTYG